MEENKPQVQASIPEEKESIKPKIDLSQIRQIYASKDGRLGVYEDAEGHLVSVDTRNFSNKNN